MNAKKIDQQTYIAERYLTGLKQEVILAHTKPGKLKKSKGRKKAGADEGEQGLRINDGSAFDDAERPEEDFVDDGAVTLQDPMAGTVPVFQAASKSNWTSISAPGVQNTPLPTVKVEPGSESLAPKPAVGLQTAADLREMRRLNEAAKADLVAKSKAAPEQETHEQQTVYRDQTGRKIDLAAERAKEEAEKQKAAAIEAEKQTWGQGLVQRREKEQRALEQKAMRAKPTARYADDRQMNDELRQRMRVDDPAASFLTKPIGPSADLGELAYEPKFVGALPPPNRFGILPGYRWDGVQRSNGFERRYMDAVNARSVRQAVSHAYAREDM